MSRLGARLANAIPLLGQGFIAHPANTVLRKSLKSSLDADSYYRQLTYLAYRLVFLLLAEDRSLLHDPQASDGPRVFYKRAYSISRLRDLARPAVQPDTGAALWHGLGRVFTALCDEGDAELGLPPLRGSFWSSASTPHLVVPSSSAGARHVELSDSYLLQVIAALVEDDGLYTPAEPRHTHEELGSSYETLLTFHPNVDLDASHKQDRFTLSTPSAHARKASGSYYTPDPLVQVMLNSALEPVINECTQGLEGDHAARAILNQKICDPACGAGYFLIAAARRLALKLAQVRSGRANPPPETVQSALCDVSVSCIYGVDLNPLAADLCKVNLWFACAKPALPLSNLDAHIKCGNALVGATPELMAAGIPDEAFTPRPGDDRKAAAQYKARNRRERQGSRTAAMPAAQHPARPSENARLVADAWCASFLWKKAPPTDLAPPNPCITESIYRTIEREPRSVARQTLDEVARLASEHRFFHWELEFPEVFSRERPGFDVVLGNPPFLNQLETATATARGPDAIIRLRTQGVTRGYTDLSATFLILAMQVTASGGRISLVQPQSLLAVKDAEPIRRAALERASLEMLWVSNEHLFQQAGIYTCALTLHPAGPRKAALHRLATGAFTRLPPLTIDNDVLAENETWSHLVAIASGVPEIQVIESRSVSDMAHATADFRDQYYGLEGFLIEDATLTPQQREQWDHFPPILTSGLIDLCQCHWGHLPTRILKAQWHAPRIDRQRMESAGALGPWLNTRLVPKILVAAQTRIIEVLIDPEGRFVPSVPLITVTPNDPAQLWLLAAAIASPACSAIAMQRYAGSAMNVDAIKLSAAQILRLPLPTDQPAWDLAADALREVGATPDPAARTAALHAFARAACDAYAIPEPDELIRWWLQRLERKSRRKPLASALPDAKPA